MPFAVVTVTSTVPLPDGLVAVIEVAELTTTPVAAVVPNFTVVPEAKFVPVIATLVLPDVDPASGETAVTVGAAPP